MRDGHWEPEPHCFPVSGQDASGGHSGVYRYRQVPGAAELQQAGAVPGSEASEVPGLRAPGVQRQALLQAEKAWDSGAAGAFWPPADSRVPLHRPWLRPDLHLPELP